MNPRALPKFKAMYIRRSIEHSLTVHNRVFFRKFENSKSMHSVHHATKMQSDMASAHK